jgi:hypothetical protein
MLLGMSIVQAKQANPDTDTEEDYSMGHLSSSCGRAAKPPLYLWCKETREANDQYKYQPIRRYSFFI